MASGTSRFLNILPDLTSDLPLLASYFSPTLVALLWNEAFEPKDLVWQRPNKGEEEDEDDVPSVDDYFKTIAEFLALW